MMEGCWVERKQLKETAEEPYLAACEGIETSRTQPDIMSTKPGKWRIVFFIILIFLLFIASNEAWFSLALV